MTVARPTPPGASCPRMQDDPRERELTWLRKLNEVLSRLAQEKDPARLMPLLLDTAIELTSAERGFLVRVLARPASGPAQLRVEVARGFDKETLRGDAGQVSRTVVNRVLERGGPLLSAGEDQDVREVTSVVQRRVMAVLCVPLRLSGEVRAVIYLDHRHLPGAFSLEHVTVAQAFADQAALALDAALARRASGGPAAARDLEGLAEAPWPPEVPGWGGLVGGSPAFQELVRTAEALPPRGHLLISGEPGSGRRALAKELHARRGGGELVTVACAGLDPEAQLVELVGSARRKGALVAAGEGTLVLADVDRVTGAALDALVRAIREGKVRVPGANRDKEVGCRIVATTARPPGPELLAAGLAQLRVPPLRERPADVLPLLAAFLGRLRTPLPEPTREAREALLRCAWPGNVAQLEQEALQLAGLGLSRLERKDLSPAIGEGVGGAGPLAGKTLAEIEREALATALREAGGNRTLASRQLGIPKSTLYYLLDRHSLREPGRIGDASEGPPSAG